MSAATVGTFIGGFLLAVVLTRAVMALAWRWRAIDDPSVAPERKRHSRPTPLLGGLAIIGAQIVSWWLLYLFGQLPGELPVKYLTGLTAAGCLLAIGGVIDDVRRRSPGQQIAWPILAALVVVAGGIGVKLITNPFGGLLYLDAVNIQLFTWHGTPYFLTLWADLFTFSWLIGAMYTTKLLDGLDGLVSGLGVIGSLIVFALTLRPEVNQPAVGLLAVSLAGAAAGFLVFNWHPARIFLGESGSLFIGFMLGVLAIISGGKIATALLILGLPILDVMVVVVRRRFFQHTSAWRTSDRSHLHFRLLDAGLSTRQVVLVLYGVTAVFGLATLFVHGLAKIYALGVLVVVMAGLVWWVVWRSSQRNEKE